jgi:TolB-like protein/Flp pilus assembly protein TadD
MSGDPAQQYFSDGITEDIITELARFRQLQVMACTSSVGYRGQDPDMIRMGRELGVHYLLEGSVRRLGDRLRITAQLIDAASAHHLWAERFDRNQSEIFNVQDELVRTIVGTLVGRVQADRAAQLRRKPPASLEAYECLLRGDALPIGNPADEAEARRLYEKAVELDPGYARAYAFLAISCWYVWRRDMSGSTAALDQAFELGQKAVALDESDYQCHQFLGYIFLQRRAYDLAEYHYRRALALNNNRSPVVASMGQFYTYMGQPAKSLDCFQEAKRLDPFFEPSWYWLRLGLAYFAAGDYDMAITQMSRAPNLSFWGEAYLAACCALTDRIEQARDHAGEALRLLPAMTASGFAAKEPYKSATDRQRLIDALRKAGLPD